MSDKVEELRQGMFNKYVDNITEVISKTGGDEAFMRSIEDTAKITDEERQQWREEILSGAAKMMIRRKTPRWDNFSRLGDAIKTLVERDHAVEETLPSGFNPEKAFPAS